MKRLRSSEDLDSYGEKDSVKDWGRREEDSGLHRSSSSLHRSSSYYKSSDSGRKVLSSSTSRYDRLEDERESTRLVRKRSDYDLENYDRRKPYDRHREGNEKGILSSSPRAGYGIDRMYRSESFSGPRRDFPKGFRSERDRSRREGTVSSWRRFGGGKDGDDGSRSSGSEVAKGSRLEPSNVGRPKSPQGQRDVKSPAWSKDSGSEQSKSVEAKKSEDIPVESGVPNAEREEGELEPDPQPSVPLMETVGKDEAADVKLNSSEHNGTFQASKTILKEKSKKGDVSKEGSCEEQARDGLLKDVQDVTGKIKEFLDSQDSYTNGTGGQGDENEMTGENEGSSEMDGQREGCFQEDVTGTFSMKTTSLLEQREDKDVDLGMNVDCADMIGSVGISKRSEMALSDENAHDVKDKGKSVAILPSSSVHHAETSLKIESGPRDLAPSGDLEMEGPSVRGFQFFSTDPVKKQEKIEQASHTKPNDDKLALDLSLSLPNVLLPIGAQNRPQPPSSPSRARSVQSFSSFHAYSDGFTASMSFSGSHQFTHNPSCSLTHNALEKDFEQSVKSKPLFQGVDWKALASDENKIKEFPVYQAMQSRGNGLHQSQVSQGNSSGQAASQNPRVVGGSSNISLGLDRQLSFSKNLAGSQGAGSYDNGPEYNKERRLVLTEKDSGGSQRINELDGKEKVLAVTPDFAESIIMMIVSEPLHRIAQRFHDMTGPHLACVKEFVLDIISNPAKQWQLSALQKALRKKSDISQDALVNAHRTQLQILVALKTGLREFLLQKYEIPSADLAEIFLNMRCRNFTCRSLIPVDECDCKICAQRNGFCRECMCLVCSKFDMASNTCSWVGCDLCLHWCHADCGLRESHIRNGRSATGAQGTTEMQFHCVACDHPSEMFGFVKEVFQNFLKEWTAENLSRELEYVRKIFCNSEDVRGKKLHEIAIQILSKLSNRADLQEVQNHIINFFAESDSLKPGNFSGERKDLPTKHKEGTSGTPRSSQGAGWVKSVYPEKNTHLENSVNLLPGFESSRNDKYAAINMDLRPNVQKEPVFDELESIVRIKQAEAKMFQARADDARREAEALKRISVTKLDRIEEEYTSRITKLRLTEAEDMRKQKVEELHALERAYQEYFHMKMRMETDIKDLLLKMEATRRNLAA